MGGDVSAIPADLKGAVFASALRQGGAEELAQLKTLYASAESSLEESLILGAMGNGGDEATVLAALTFNMVRGWGRGGSYVTCHLSYTHLYACMRVCVSLCNSIM